MISWHELEEFFEIYEKVQWSLLKLSLKLKKVNHLIKKSVARAGVIRVFFDPYI